jgi:anti-sigma factor RsiW
MIHVAASQRLSAYLDGELVPAERRAVDEHLRICPICRRDLAALERVKHLLGALPDVEPPAGLFADVRLRLERPPGALDPLRDGLRTLVRRPAAAAVAAALVVVLIALPLAKGRLDRLQAASVGVDVYVREHALLSATDPFADRAYLGLLIGDANVALVGQRRAPEGGR